MQLPPPEPKARVDHLDTVPILEPPTTFETITGELVDVDHRLDEIDTEEDNVKVSMTLVLSIREAKQLIRSFVHATEEGCSDCGGVVTEYFIGIMSEFRDGVVAYHQAVKDGAFDEPEESDSDD